MLVALCAFRVSAPFVLASCGLLVCSTKKTDRRKTMQYHDKGKKIFYVPRERKMATNKVKGLLLSKAIEGFTLACKARRLSVHTQADYTRTLKKFLVHVGDCPLPDITPTQVEAFLAAQPFSEKTVLNYHIGLSALWTWALREGYAEKHILRIVEKPEPQKNVIEPFTETEVKAMMSSVRRLGERDKSIILLLLDTGARASEVTNCNLADIDLEKRHMLVLGKGNKKRLLPFSARTGQAIFRYLTTLDKDATHLYPFNRNSLSDLIRDIGKRAGIKKAHPHKFRHTFAINFLRNGGDPYTLQEILGHSTFEMVRRYLAIAQVDIDAAHKRASPVENWKL
jgi:site-specific recombinase XerD